MLARSTPSLIAGLAALCALIPASAFDQVRWRPPPLRPIPHLPHKTGCNGDVRYCDLRFDQYTFPGTHNSGAYNLRFDCAHALGPWKFLCLSGIPPPLMNCLWNNMRDRDVGEQLRDGVRSMDLDTCQVEDRAVLCHGQDKLRALGEELPVAFKRIARFLRDNPREVVTLEFGDNDGDVHVNAPSIARALQTYLGEHLYSHTAGEQWPTLGEMIDSGKRLVVFMADNRKGLQEDVPWILQRSNYFYGSWVYTHESMTIRSLNTTFYDYCTAGPDVAHAMQWQCLDFEFFPDATKVRELVNQHSRVSCIGDFAGKVNRWLMGGIAEYCGEQLPFVHRVRVDQYWKGDLLEAVASLNEANLRHLHDGPSCKADACPSP